MAKNKPDRAALAAAASLQPCVYPFNPKDVPIEKYGETLDLLFRNPDFAGLVEKRNRLVQSAGRLSRGTSEMANLARTIQQNDRKLADIVFACLVQANVRSDTGTNYLSFTSLLRFHADYTRDGVPYRVKRLTANLYKTTFLADMLESVVADVKADMNFIFGEEFQFMQFDGVAQCLKQLRGFFEAVRPQESESPDARLYLDYSDSINEYLAKRLKTYLDKVTRLHPENAPCDERELLAALNNFFGVEYWLGTEVVKHTEQNCPYLSVKAVLARLNDEQTRKFEKLIGGPDNTTCADPILQYDFKATNAVINRYRRKNL